MNAQLDVAINVTAKKLELATSMGESGAGMRSEQRRYLLGTFGNDKATMDAAETKMDGRVKEMRDKVAELTPLLQSEEGKRAASELVKNLDAWVAADEEVSKVWPSPGKAAEAWTVAKDRANPLIDKMDEQGAMLIRTAAGVPETVGGGGREPRMRRASGP